MPIRRVLFGAALSLLFIYLLLFTPHPLALIQGTESLPQALFGHPRIEFARLWSTILTVHATPLIISVLIIPLHVLVRSHRWTLMVSPLGRLGVMDSYSLQMVGYLSNAVLPLRAGEVIRGVLLGRKIGVPKSSALATVVSERLLDVCSLLILVVIVGFLYPFTALIKKAAFTMAFAAVLGLGIIITLASSKKRLQAVAPLLSRLLPARIGDVAGRILDNFAAGFVMPRNGLQIVIILFESALLWLMYALQGWLIIHAFDFHLDYPLIAVSPFITALVVLILNAIGLSIPSAPAAVGTFHAVCAFGLSQFGVPPEPALGFALVIHAVSMMFFAIMGIPFLWREGVRLSQLGGVGRGGENQAAFTPPSIEGGE